MVRGRFGKPLVGNDLQVRVLCTALLPAYPSLVEGNGLENRQTGKPVRRFKSFCGRCCIAASNCIHRQEAKGADLQHPYSPVRIRVDALLCCEETMMLSLFFWILRTKPFSIKNISEAVFERFEPQNSTKRTITPTKNASQFDPHFSFYCTNDSSSISMRSFSFFRIRLFRKICFRKKAISKKRIFLKR